MRRLRWTVLIGLLAAACASSDDNNNGAFDADPTEWEDCYDTATCATFDLPLDYDNPDGPTIPVGVTLVPASGDRIGPLFINPGGPGGEAGDFALYLAEILPTEVTERFDIVGVDPRGTGTGPGAIDCGFDVTELYGTDHAIGSPSDREALLDVSREYVEGCETEVGDVLPYLGTRDVARDMDAVRAALGDDQLNFLGYSYGTAIGQVYLDLFPDQVRAMVLDGVVDPAKSGLDSARDQALGFEQALASFAANCDAEPTCPLAPDAMGAIRDLIAAVDENPVPAQPRDLGPGELATGLAMPLYADWLWPRLEYGVDQALNGDGSGMVSLADDYLGMAGFDVYFAVNCLDFAWPDDPDEVLAAATDAAEVAPHFGETLVNDYIRCALWPVEPDPLTEVHGTDGPDVLVVSTTNDPATPHEAAVTVAERLESGVLLTFEGDGHGVVGEDRCIDAAVSTYLVELTPPADGTTCP